MAAFTTSRMGSGGITIPVTMDLESLRTQASTLTAKIEQLKSDVKEKAKLKVPVDLEETAFVRGLEKIRRQATREVVRVRVEAEANNLGLGQFVNRARASSSSGASVADDPLADLASAAREAKRRSGLSDGMSFRAIGGLAIGAAAATIGAAGYGGSMYAQYRNAGDLAGSGNASARLQGQIAQNEFYAGLPIIGKFFKALDELSGATRSAKFNLEAIGTLRGLGVDLASSQRNKRGAFEAQQRADMQEFLTSMATRGVDYKFDAQGEGFEGRVGEGALKNANRMLQLKRAVQSEQKARFEEEHRLEINMNRRMVDVTNMSLNQPMGGAMLEMKLRNAAREELADKEVKPWLVELGKAQVSDLERRQRRQIAFDSFESETRIGAAQMRVQNRGMNLSDESTMVRLRELRKNIDLATEEGGYKDRARIEAFAEARAMKAGFMVRGGGMGRITNMGTDVVGDPFLLNPEAAANKRSVEMIDLFMKQMGGGAAVMNLAAGMKEATGMLGPGGQTLGKDPVFQQILGALNSIKDNLGSAVRLAN